ncbi:hypothetical protein J2D73_17560 [Acetobacter sacchari]|uniref:Transposase n=1 Tax=Acetobacter sacchari TaxID=2661687 RepID=A0ABS3M0A6_9PROT|nr:hypothetical protein [Acetobacter sacchari]MBO1361596.1 hypothetical protein [Acetobacter sacchari]
MRRKLGEHFTARLIQEWKSLDCVWRQLRKLSWIRLTKRRPEPPGGLNMILSEPYFFGPEPQKGIRTDAPDCVTGMDQTDITRHDVEATEINKKMDQRDLSTHRRVEPALYRIKLFYKSK